MMANNGNKERRDKLRILNDNSHDENRNILNYTQPMINNDSSVFSNCEKYFNKYEEPLE